MLVDLYDPSTDLSVTGAALPSCLWFSVVCFLSKGADVSASRDSIYCTLHGVCATVQVQPYGIAGSL